MWNLGVLTIVVILVKFVVNPVEIVSQVKIYQVNSYQHSLYFWTIPTPMYSQHAMCRFSTATNSLKMSLLSTFVAGCIFRWANLAVISLTAIPHANLISLLGRFFSIIWVIVFVFTQSNIVYLVGFGIPADEITILFSSFCLATHVNRLWQCKRCFRLQTIRYSESSSTPWTKVSMPPGIWERLLKRALSIITLRRSA